MLHGQYDDDDNKIISMQHQNGGIFLNWKQKNHYPWVLKLLPKMRELSE